MVAHLALEGVSDLGRLNGAAEHPGEGVADGALQSPLKALDDAHRHLLCRPDPVRSHPLAIVPVHAPISGHGCPTHLNL
jgi:hypothetical protein